MLLLPLPGSAIFPAESGRDSGARARQDEKRILCVFIYGVKSFNFFLFLSAVFFLPAQFARVWLYAILTGQKSLKRGRNGHREREELSLCLPPCHLHPLLVGYAFISRAQITWVWASVYVSLSVCVQDRTSEHDFSECPFSLGPASSPPPSPIHLPYTTCPRWKKSHSGEWTPNLAVLSAIFNGFLFFLLALFIIF